MRYIEATENFIIFCCRKAVLIYQKGGSEGRILNLPTPNTTPGSEVRAVCIKLSSDERYLAVACESKVVTIWCTQTWTLQCTHKLVKRPMSIDITADCTILLVADKTGDVYHFPLKGSATSEKDYSSNHEILNEKNSDDDDDKAESEALLGHLSMLLDVAITHDSRYIITCDRDEKIRVSHYPNSYNIESFCLGHTEFVNQIHLLSDREPLLISCSGDGTIKLWNYMNGQCLSTADTHEHTTTFLRFFEEYCQEKVKDSEEAKRYLPDHPAVKDFAVCATKDGPSYVAVVVDRVPALFLYELEEKKLHYVSTVDMKETLPLAVTWLNSEDLLVEQNSVDQPVGIYHRKENMLAALDEHPLISFGRRHKDSFIDGGKELSIDILYKQRYDNVADYLKKKQERLDTEKAVEAGAMPPVKKGRWV